MYGANTLIIFSHLYEKLKNSYHIPNAYVAPFSTCDNQLLAFHRVNSDGKYPRRCDFEDMVIRYTKCFDTLTVPLKQTNRTSFINMEIEE